MSRKSQGPKGVTRISQKKSQEKINDKSTIYHSQSIIKII